MKKSQFNLEILEEYRQKNHLSKKAFCELCKINTQVYNKMLVHKLNFRFTAAIRVANLIGCKLSELIIFVDE